MKRVHAHVVLFTGLGAATIGIAGCGWGVSPWATILAGANVLTLHATHQTGSTTSRQLAVDSLLQPSSDWPTFGNNLWQDRVSPITFPTNQQQWRLLYSLPVSPGGSSESFPLEQGGVLYFTTMRGQVMAMDAVTGRLQWQYTPKLDLLQGIPTINRGVALGDGKVFVLTADDRLIALSARTGHVLYQVTVADQAEGYFETMAPLYVDGKVFVGSAGGDEGIRGFEACVMASDGKLLWKTYTVPQRGHGWLPKSGQHGGGAVWNVPAYNPITQQLFFGTGNPSPDFFGAGRSGPDPMTDAVVSVQSATGRVDWYRQEVAHDLWDYDVASPPMLFFVRSHLAVGEAGKDGQWYEWYAQTGKPVIAPVAFVKEQHRPPTATATLEWPGSDGGANYGPSAYDPGQRTVIISGINGPEYVRAEATQHQSYRVDDGTSAVPAPTGDWTGTLTSISTLMGKVMWQKRLATPAIGGVTATLGGTAFFGEANGWLYGVNMATGKTVWSYHARIPAGGAPIVYSVHNQIFLTFVLGQSASLQGLFPYSGETRILTFRLAGK